MKRIFAAILLLLMVLPLAVACNTDEGSGAESGSVSNTEESKDLTTDSNAASFWSEAYADTKNGIDTAEKVYSFGAYADGVSLGSVSEANGTDKRFLFGGDGYTRAVNLPEGYCVTLPGGNVEADFNLGALRSQYFTDDYCLTLTYENKNPYGNNQNGWDIYTGEWLTEQFGDLEFLKANNLRRTRTVIENAEDILEGYSVTIHSITINLPLKIEMP